MPFARCLTPLVAALAAGALAVPASAQDTKVAIAISGWTGFAPLTSRTRRACSRSTGWT